jgi:DNA-binding MarR family transcriptional regulator
MQQENIFSFENPEENAGFLLWQVSMLWQLRMKHGLDKLNITLTQFALLAALHWLTRNGETVTQGVVASHAKTDKMMTSKVLRTMEEKNWVIRQGHVLDTRSKILKLTDEGLAILKKANAIVEPIDEQFFSPFGQYSEKFKGMMQLLYIGNKTMP